MQLIDLRVQNSHLSGILPPQRYSLQRPTLRAATYPLHTSGLDLVPYFIRQRRARSGNAKARPGNLPWQQNGNTSGKTSRLEAIHDDRKILK
jgi:hypothetical protein